MSYYRNFNMPSPINYQQTRFIGPLLPFVGGLLVGGLFAPSKGPLYPPVNTGGYPNNPPYPVYYYPIPNNPPTPNYYINPYQPTPYGSPVDGAMPVEEPQPTFSYPPYPYM